MSESQGTLLIVDDERSIRVSLRTILSNLGFEIVEAARGEEALSLVRTAQLDAVLLDINMPGMGGVEVCRVMRRESTRLPIVMLTVQGSEDRKVEALEAGADDYITKPFQLRELIARLRAAVRRNKAFDTQETVINVGEVRLDPARQVVQKKGRASLDPKAV